MATVRLNNCQKKYDETLIINDVNIDVNEGEFIVIVGPSGCGKSTLLRMIAGLEEISSGEISIADKIVNNVPPKSRDIAMVFQNYALYPHMNVYDNMGYGLKIRGYKKDDIQKRVHKAAESLQLTEFLERKPSQLSGGQRQRVAMGRALVRKPSVFLFDEPLSNLDAKLRVQMRLEIKRLHKELKTTSIYVTHDQLEAMTLADRLLVLNKGIVEQIGTPLDIYRKPASLFVAGFIGSTAMNFIPAIISNDGKQVIVNSDFKLPITIDLPKSEYGNEITLGIRPENIIAAKEDSDNPFALTIDFVEELGSDTLVYGHLAASNEQLTARLPGKWHQESDQNKVNVFVRPNSLHLFNKETGQRIHPTNSL